MTVFTRVLHLLCQSEKLRSQICGAVCCTRCRVARLCVLYWESGATHFVSRFFWFGYRQLGCVDVCEYASSFSAQIYLLKEKHICIKKKASEHRKNVYFVFLSVASRHAGFRLPLRDFEHWLSSQMRRPTLPPTGKLSFLRGVGGG